MPLNRIAPESPLITKNHRKYVWNDFSIVEKAKIQIIGSHGYPIGSCLPGSKNELYQVAVLYVQINPKEFGFEHYMDPQSILNELELNHQTLDKSFVLHSFSGGYERNTFNPTLMFDIYDEYNARTTNGTIPTDFSLMNDRVTSLPLLIRYAESNQLFARFIWGDIVKFGLLTGINVTYHAFSQWGQPLKATATLNITEQQVKGGPKGVTIEGEDLNLMTAGSKLQRIATGVQNIFR